MSRDLKVGEQLEVRLKSWKLGRSKEKNTPFIRLIFENYISKDLWVTQKNMPNLMPVLELLGYNQPTLKGIADENALEKEKIVLVTIDSIREYEGKKYYEASWINDPDKIMQGYNSKGTTPDLLDELDRFDTRAYIDTNNDTQDYSNGSSMEDRYDDNDIPAWAR